MPSHASKVSLSAKNDVAPKESPSGTFRNSREIPSSPAVKSHRPLSTTCNSAPPENRFRFKSVTAIEPPEKVRDKFQFSFRASKKIRRRFAGCRKSGDEKLPATLRFSESQRKSESKLIASPRKL